MHVGRLTAERHSPDSLGDARPCNVESRPNNSAVHNGAQEHMASRYQLKQAADGQFMFNLKAGNGEVLLTSERYKTKASAENGIESVRKNSPLDERYDRRESSAGQPYFVLKAANHEVIGKSEMYSSLAAAENGIVSVKRNGGGARVDDETGAQPQPRESPPDSIDDADSGKERQLIIEIDFPDGYDGLLVVGVAKQAAAHADALYRAHGGSGLQLDDIEAFEESPAPVSADS